MDDRCSALGSSYEHVGRSCDLLDLHYDFVCEVFVLEEVTSAQGARVLVTKNA